MKKKDPVLDSAAFTSALQEIFLENPAIYRASVMFFLDGLKPWQISKELNVANSTTTTYLQRAREIIREHFTKNAPHLLDLPAIVTKHIEEFTRAEAEAMREKFPFVKR